MDTSILGEFGWLLITFAAAMFILAGIVMLLKASRKPATHEKLYYEHFESPDDWSVSALRKRIDEIRNVKEELLVYSEDVGILADETCAIMKTVEDKYVGNASQLSNASDYELPAAERDAKIAHRQKLARRRWVEQQSMYSAVNGSKPLLECFYASSEDVGAAESELNIQIADLEKILDTAQVKAAVLKKEKAAMSLGFSLQYLNDAVKSVQKQEGFYADLTGAALIARADELIGKARAMKQELSELDKSLNKANSMIDIINKAPQKAERSGGSSGAMARIDARNDL